MKRRQEQMHTPEDITAQKLLTELKDGAEEEFGARGTRRNTWRVAHYTFGVIPAVAVIITGAALTNAGMDVPTAAVVVLISGALSLAVTFYDFRARMVNNSNARAAWGGLRDRASAVLADKESR